MDRLRRFLLDVTTASPSALDFAVTDITVDYELAEWLLENRGPDRDYLRDMVNRFRWQNRTARDKRPVILLMMPDKTFLLVDGTHRYIASALTGATSVQALIVPPAVWKVFDVEGLPVLSTSLGSA